MGEGWGVKIHLTVSLLVLLLLLMAEKSCLQLDGQDAVLLMFIVGPVSSDFVWRTQESWDSIVVWNCIGEGWRTPPGCPCDLGEICGHFGRSWERGAWPAQNLSIVLRLMEPPRVMRLYCTCKYLCYLMDILGAREKSLGHGQLKIVYHSYTYLCFGETFWVLVRRA